MTTWTDDELNDIGTIGELEISSFKKDGTPRNPVTIWVVRVGDDLFVRSWRGRSGSWFRSARVRHEGHIRAGNIKKEVTFVEEADPYINDAIDDAYRARYGCYSQYVAPMVSPDVRSATIKLVQRDG